MILITQAEFTRLVKLVESNYGINLSQKKHLIEGRLSGTLMAKGFTNYTQYIDLLMKKNPNDVEEMLNKLTTNHTFFMRENAHFAFFKDTILPYLEKTKTDRVLSIWSAGCSSGEEPYTLSMLIFDYFGANVSRWDTRILATDISQKVLTTAKLGRYKEESLKDMPKEWISKYFTRVSDGYEVTKQIKDNVIYRTFNLMDPITFKSKFDVIFCRNVMIYFDMPVKDALVDRFYNATNPGGYLLIGHSETLNKDRLRYNYLMPATYRK